MDVPQVDTTVRKVYPFLQQLLRGEGREGENKDSLLPTLPFSGGWLGWLGYDSLGDERLHLSLIRYRSQLLFWYEPGVLPF